MKLGEQLYYQSKKTKPSTVIITHRNCPDGSAAAVIAKKAFPDVFWFPATHQKVNDHVVRSIENLTNEGKLYVVDISCSPATLLKVLPIIAEKKAHLYIFDHHETTTWLTNFVEEILLVEFPNFPTDRLEIIFDQTRCGSKIFYDKLLPKHPELVDYDDFICVNNDRDLWLQKDERSENLARFHEVSQDEGYVERFLRNPKMEFDEKEQYLLDNLKMSEELKQEKLLKNIQIKRDEEDFKYGVIFGEADSSNLLNKAIERFDLEYALLVNLNTKKASIRGRGEKDCSKYAEKFGGGGHKRASGFQFQFQEPKF